MRTENRLSDINTAKYTQQASPDWIDQLGGHIASIESHNQLVQITSHFPASSAGLSGARIGQIVEFRKFPVKSLCCCLKKPLYCKHAKTPEKRVINSSHNLPSSKHWGPGGGSGEKICFIFEKIPTFWISLPTIL